MKIAIDFRCAQFGREGLFRAVFSLVEALRDKHKLHLLLTDPKIKIPQLTQDPNLHFHYLSPKSNKLSLLWENTSLVSFLKRERPKVYIAPFNYGLPMRKIQGIIYIAVVHDLIPEIMPNLVSWTELIKWKIGIRTTVKTADFIIADSAHTKSDIIQYYNVPSDKIIVLHYYVDGKPLNVEYPKDAEREILLKYGLNSPFVLYYSGFRPYKNVGKIIQVYDFLRKNYSEDFQLCLAGNIPNKFKKNIYSFLTSAKHQKDIKFSGYVPDNDLLILLKNAGCFMFLSKYEGFGYPPLEAQFAGTPVLCARNSSLIENLNDSVIWVDNNESVEDIAHKLHKLLTISQLRTEIIEKGYKNIKNFSKEKYGEKLNNIILKAKDMNT